MFVALAQIWHHYGQDGYVTKIIKNLTEYEPLDSTGKLSMEHRFPPQMFIQLGKKKWSIENIAVMKLCAASMLSDRKYTKDVTLRTLLKTS